MTDREGIKGVINIKEEVKCLKIDVGGGLLGMIELHTMNTPEWNI